MELEKFLHEKMRSFGAATYKKFLCCELIYHWHELVDENISAKVKPVKIERGILYVDVKSAAFRDQLKFLAEEILDAINEKFAEEEPLVKQIRIASVFQIADMPPEKNSPPAQVDTPKIKLEDITLTEEEISRCEEQSKKISNEKLRETIFQTLLSQAKAQKFRLANGWHKCAKCETLCAPEENFCEVCKMKERETMVNTLFKIFYDTPQLKTWDAQKILLEKMPHMKNECSLAAIESARTSLIQKIAGKVRIGDEESPDVLKLVALEKRLPLDKLTPAIIRQTLVELQFNLSEQSKIQRYNAALKNRK
jgi:hypothetical protein